MRMLAALALIACFGAPACAESGGAPDPAATENGRYAMTPAPDGFLRLDTRTGAVSLCRVENGAARCQAAAEERAALSNEIDRLARQNDALKARSENSLQLPSRQDFDRALDYAEQFMRRMMKLMREDDSQKDHT